jgi:hypothetical protein
MASDEQHPAPTLAVVGGARVREDHGATIRPDTDRGSGVDSNPGAALARPARPDTTPPPLVCLVAAERADVLLPPLREHFAHEPLVTVIVERRTPRRPLGPAAQPRRRAPIAERDPMRALPPELHHEAGELRLVQRLEPLRRTHEDSTMTDLIAKCLAIEPEAASELWWRISERVLARLTLHLGQLAAGDAARAMLGRILDELPGYQAEREPLSAWLDAVVDRYADDHKRRRWDQSG